MLNVIQTIINLIKLHSAYMHYASLWATPLYILRVFIILLCRSTLNVTQLSNMTETLFLACKSF